MPKFFLTLLFAFLLVVPASAQSEDDHFKRWTDFLWQVEVVKTLSPKAVCEKLASFHQEAERLGLTNSPAVSRPRSRLLEKYDCPPTKGAHLPHSSGEVLFY